jgi:hypothetical protein
MLYVLVEEDCSAAQAKCVIAQLWANKVWGIVRDCLITMVGLYVEVATMEKWIN